MSVMNISNIPSFWSNGVQVLLLDLTKAARYSPQARLPPDNRKFCFSRQFFFRVFFGNHSHVPLTNILA